MKLKDFKIASRHEALTLLELIAYLFTQIPSKRIDQTQATASSVTSSVVFNGQARIYDIRENECGACVGLWITIFFSISKAEALSIYSFLDGETIFERLMYKLGYSKRQANILLYELAFKVKYRYNNSAFGPRKWRVPPKIVFRKLIDEIEGMELINFFNNTEQETEK